MQAVSSRELLDRFKMEKVFWRQFEIGQALAAANNRGAIAELEMWLTHDDRHLRGNVAFVLGRLGDPRGFETIAAILADRSPRSAGQGIPGGNWTVHAQIRADRYYAAHLLGDLKDPRGVDLLIPLLNDEDVDYIVPWSLAEIGDRRGIGPLVAQTDRDDPSLRVLAIGALERLKAREALPRPRQLLQDDRKANFGDRTTVADAAKRAIAVISQDPRMPLSLRLVGGGRTPERLTPRGGPRQSAVVGVPQIANVASRDEANRSRRQPQAIAANANDKDDSRRRRWTR